MKLSWWKAIAAFFLAATLSAPAWAANPATPGTLNYVEGQTSLGDQALTSQSVGSTELQPGQTLTTGNGRAEVLLTPGVFLRLDDNSAVKMISPSLTNTQVELDKGRAEVEVAELYKQNNIQVKENGVTTRLNKVGLDDFSADENQVRVFKGEAQVLDGDQDIKVKGGHELTLNAGNLKAVKFDQKADENDFYNWSGLRSEYLAEANVNAATLYVGNSWGGPGWYWDPWFSAYTFIPGDGFLYSPFGGGWGFYSPGWAFYAPGYYGYGYRPVFHPGPIHGFAGGRPFPRGGAVMPHGFAGGGRMGGFHGGGMNGGGIRR